MQTSKFRANLTRGLVIATIATFVFLILSENIFEYVVLSNLPIKHVQGLLLFYASSTLAMVIGLSGSAYILSKLYKKFEPQHLPFIGYLWIFAGLMMFFSLIFTMNLVNLWRTYYWIDAALRALAGIFSIGGFFTLIKGYKYIVNFKTVDEYKALTDEIERLKGIEKEIQNFPESQKPH